MPVKKYKPTTPGRRKASVNTFEGISKKEPEKSLLKTVKKSSGRNSSGRITVRHRGGGVKKKYRLIDFRRDKFDIPAKVQAIEYDPNRSARIAFLVYKDGEKRYVLAPVGLKEGDEVVSSKSKVKVAPGNRTTLANIPLGTMVYNVELHPAKGGQIGRSGGNLINLMAVEGKYAQIKMPSGEIRLVPKECMASIGQVSNPEHSLVRLGKAGRKRYLGVRPTVRGKAMNPHNHPHGGGEGGSPIGLKHPKTPWGKPALGVKTRQKHKDSDKLIIYKRKKKRRKR